MPIKTYSVNSVTGVGFRTECSMEGHTVIIDQPGPMSGDDGPNPLLYQLVSLAGCLSAISRIVASQRRIDLRGIRVAIRAEIDTDFLMGATTEGRAGFSSINASVDLDSDMARAEKLVFLAEVDRRCPISDILMVGTNVAVTLD